MSPLIQKALFQKIHPNGEGELHNHWKVYIISLYETQSLRDATYFGEAIILAATARLLLSDTNTLTQMKRPATYFEEAPDEEATVSSHSD